MVWAPPMTDPRLRFAGPSLLLSLFAACASAPSRPPPAVASATLEPSVPVRAASQTEPAARSRREIIRGVLGHNVRVLVHDGERQRRVASGVVISVQQDGERPTSYVVTNAHVVDTTGYAAPRFSVVVDRRAESVEYPAKRVAIGKVPDMDLGLVAVEGLALPAAGIARTDELELGEEVIVAAAPYGRPISLSGGMISHLDWDPTSGEPRILKTDAAIGYGASGGGIYSLSTGKLVGIVEGYRTAKVSFAVAKEDFSFDVPMPGETFAAPTAKLRAFLDAQGFGHLLVPRAERLARRAAP